MRGTGATRPFFVRGLGVLDLGPPAFVIAGRVRQNKSMRRPVLR